jgi:hypothetical protein
MKKIACMLTLIPGLLGASASHAVDITAQAVATWSATAKKDTSSQLVVTPLGSLAFQYAEGVKNFNSQKGLFDVTIEGDSSATEFKLTSKLLSDTLTHLDGSNSTLVIGVSYNGEPLDKTTDLVMIDTAKGILGGNLNALANGYNQSERVSAQDQFSFNVISATSNGQEVTSDFSSLPDGIWSGDISVQFNATWTS